MLKTCNQHWIVQIQSCVYNNSLQQDRGIFHCKLNGNIIIESPLKFPQIELELNNNLMSLFLKRGKIFVEFIQLLEPSLSPRNIGGISTQSNAPSFIIFFRLIDKYLKKKKDYSYPIWHSVVLLCHSFTHLLILSHQTLGTSSVSDAVSCSLNTSGNKIFKDSSPCGV